jgi:hypothetical protein
MTKRDREYEGFAVIMDALGAKQIADPWELYGKIKELLAEDKRSVRSIFSGEALKYIKVVRRRFAVNDMIILCYQHQLDFVTDLSALIVPIQSLVWKSMSIKFPIRGAVSYGKYIIPEDDGRQGHELFILGEPVNDAVQWYEQADWVGIMLTPEFTLHIEKLIDKETDFELKAGTKEEWADILFPMYKVPMKNGGLRETRAVGWPLMQEESTLDSLGMEALRRCHSEQRKRYLDYYNKMNKEIPPHAQQKYLNALAFLDWCWERAPEIVKRIKESSTGCLGIS